MEKVKEIENTYIELEHLFFCDSCGKSLGSVVEYPDGYYPKFGEFKLSFRLPDGWYKVEKNFCDKCREEFIESLRTKLINVGFEKSE